LFFQPITNPVIADKLQILHDNRMVRGLIIPERNQALARELVTPKTKVNFFALGALLQFAISAVHGVLRALTSQAAELLGFHIPFLCRFFYFTFFIGEQNRTGTAV
jgi:hypothetical protein